MSQDYVIITDSTSDLPQKRIDEWGISYIPYKYTLGKEEYEQYLDAKRGMSAMELYDNLREGKTGTTSQVTQHRYIQTFEPFLKQGKDVLYMCLSSGLSKSYEQSVLAANELNETYPDRKVITIDTLSASLGQGLLAQYAAEAQKNGMSLDDNAEYIKGLAGRLQHWVTVDDLHHLRRGGRVSGAQAFLGSMLSVKPILIVNHKGELVPYHKTRGRVKSLEYLADRVAEFIDEPSGQTIAISHSDAAEDAKKLRDMINAKCGKHDFLINHIGPVIGVHTGPGAIALIFLAKERIKVDKK